jgi:hypothetical protein
MNREMDGQLTIRDETKSTSTAVAGPDQGHHFTKGDPQWEDKCGFWKNSGPASFRQYVVTLLTNQILLM